MTKKIIVRADDLGICEGVNHGIAKAVNDGIIKSVGIMTNMPATQHGYDLVKDSGACFGLHTNICLGKPITDPKLIPSICDEQGNFKSSKTYRGAKEDFVVFEEVVLEVEAQYQRFVALTGHKPVYFEGHAVASANFFKALEYVAKKHECDYLALSMGAPATFRHTPIHVSFESVMPDYNPFEALKRAALKEVDDGGIVTMICHPGYLDAFILKNSSMTACRPLETEMASSEETKQWLKEHDVEVITYGDLA